MCDMSTTITWKYRALTFQLTIKMSAGIETWNQRNDLSAAWPVMVQGFSGQVTWQRFWGGGGGGGGGENKRSGARGGGGGAKGGGGGVGVGGGGVRGGWIYRVRTAGASVGDTGPVRSAWMWKDLHSMLAIPHTMFFFFIPLVLIISGMIIMCYCMCRLCTRKEKKIFSHLAPVSILWKSWITELVQCPFKTCSFSAQIVWWTGLQIHSLDR